MFSFLATIVVCHIALCLCFKTAKRDNSKGHFSHNTQLSNSISLLLLIVIQRPLLLWYVLIVSHLCWAPLVLWHFVLVWLTFSLWNPRLFSSVLFCSHVKLCVKHISFELICFTEIDLKKKKTTTATSIDSHLLIVLWSFYLQHRANESAVAF